MTIIMNIIKFEPPRKCAENVSLPPDYDALMRDCIRNHAKPKTLLDACQYFPRLDASLQSIARHILDIPFENETLLNKCINSAINASLVMKTRPFLMQGTEERAYVSILSAATQHLQQLQHIEVCFNKDGKRTEWNPLESSLHELWTKYRVKPEYRRRPHWQKTDMTSDNKKFHKMLAAKLFTPADYLLFSDQHLTMEFV